MYGYVSYQLIFYLYNTNYYFKLKKKRMKQERTNQVNSYKPICISVEMAELV